MRLSRAVRICLLFLLALTAGLQAQSLAPANSSNAKGFLGKWQSKFHGKVFVTILLTGDAQKLTGTMSKASVELNQDGSLASAEPNDGSNSITHAQVNGKELHFTSESSDGTGDSIDWEIVLVGADEAELQPIVPPDVPKPKPWKLTRVPRS
jgi:hypothetical protein